MASPLRTSSGSRRRRMARPREIGPPVMRVRCPRWWVEGGTSRWRNGGGTHRNRSSAGCGKRIGSWRRPGTSRTSRGTSRSGVGLAGPFDGGLRRSLQGSREDDRWVSSCTRRRRSRRPRAPAPAPLRRPPAPRPRSPDGVSFIALNLSGPNRCRVSSVSVQLIETKSDSASSSSKPTRVAPNFTRVRDT